MFRLESTSHPVGAAATAASRALKHLTSTVFIALALAMVVSSAAAEASPGGVAVYGYDVSFPQCKTGLPPVVTGQHVVGVNGGRPFTANPCFSAEIQWANRGNPRPAVYMNLDYPRGAELGFAANGPRGACAASDQSCKAFNYGYNAAADATHRAGVAADTVWWLDIETANYWSPNPALNAEVIHGALSYFQSQQLAVGIYSIGPMWKTIAGGYAPGVQLWVASWRSNVPTIGYCSPAYAFGGGNVTMVQTYSKNQDVNFLCPGARLPSASSLVLSTDAGNGGGGGPEGTLTPSRGGSSVQITSDPVSSGQWVTYRLSLSPSGPNVANGLFITAYQNGVEVLHAHATDTPTPGSIELKIQSHSASPIVYQITSYDDPAAVPSITYSMKRE